MWGSEWAHLIAHPWVPISSPLTHMVYHLPSLHYIFERGVIVLVKKKFQDPLRQRLRFGGTNIGLAKDLAV